MKFVPKGRINNIQALVQVMAWCRPGDKPLTKPMVVRLPTHICVTRPQWVKPSEPSSIVNNISRLEKCVDDIRAWMKLNLLKLNDDKTGLLVITSWPSMSQSLHISIQVGDQDISPSEEPPKNLGVIFDSTCSLRDHVSNVCRSINFNLYSIGKIRKYFDWPTVEKLVNATIT